MRSTVRLRWLALIAFAIVACQVLAQAFPNNAPMLKISVYGTELIGERELESQGQGKTTAELEAMFTQAQRVVRSGETFQLTAELVNQDGSRTDVTRDPRIRYEALNCMTVSPAGLVTATPAGECYGASMPRIWIMLLGVDNRVVAWNRVFFRVQ